MILSDAKANKTDVDASLLLRAKASDWYIKVQTETKLARTVQLDDVLKLYLILQMGVHIL